MTGRRKKFFEEYIKNPLNSRNGKQAAIAAGYSEKSAKQQAYRLLHSDAEIIAAIKDYDEEQHKLKTAEENEIVEFLTSVMRGEEVETTPIYIKKGVQDFREGKPTAKDRLRAAEMLGKYYAMFTDKAEDNSESGGVIIIPEVISDG